MASYPNVLSYLKRNSPLIGTLLFDLFLLWILIRYGNEGLSLFFQRLTDVGSSSWFTTYTVLTLILIKSDVRDDLPLFAAALILGFWGEWWGTTQGLWTYYTRQTPPVGIVFMWGVGLLTVYHLHLFISRILPAFIPKQKLPVTPIKLAIIVLLLLAGFALTWKGIVKINWLQHVDIHFVLAGMVTGFLFFRNFDTNETFSIFLCGTLLGGLYEYCGTSIGGWSYATGQGLPLVIAPLWGIACVAMIKLGFLIKQGVIKLIGLLIPQMKSKPSSI